MYTLLYFFQLLYVSFTTELQPWTATILGHDEEIYSTEAATEIPIC